MIRRILILDVDSDYFQQLAKMLPEVDFDTTSTVEKASQLFKNNFYGLVFIDLNILSREILEFLENIRTGNYYGEVLFTGDYMDSGIRMKIAALKKLKVLIKPIDMKWLASQIQSYFNKNVSLGNSIDDIGVELFLRLLNLGKCSVTLKTSCLNGNGEVRFENGQIVSAKYGKAQSVEALANILSMCYGKIEILKNKTSFQKQAASDFEQMLNESLEKRNTIQAGDVKTDPWESVFIDFIRKKINELTDLNSDMILNKKFSALGVNPRNISEEIEIDLIELVAREIKDVKKKLIFKKSMVEFIRKREKRKFGGNNGL